MNQNTPVAKIGKYSVHLFLRYGVHKQQTQSRTDRPKYRMPTAQFFDSGGGEGGIKNWRHEKAVYSEEWVLSLDYSVGISWIGDLMKPQEPPAPAIDLKYYLPICHMIQSSPLPTVPYRSKLCVSCAQEISHLKSVFEWDRNALERCSGPFETTD